MAKKRPNLAARRGRDRGSTGDDYTGRSGQLVAIPEVDRGKDVFAFMEGRLEVAHIQVKTAKGKRYQKEDGYRAKFSIPKIELNDPDSLPLIFYVLAARLEAEWADFLVIGQDQMMEFYWARRRQEIQNAGSTDFVFTVQFRPNQVICAGVDWTVYRNAWKTLPSFEQRIRLAGPETDAPQAPS